jgi:hypothetical protein
MAIAARKAGRPVKWVEERSEHVVAATSATDRVTTLSAAVGDDGVVTALDWDQLEDCGAYLRAAISSIAFLIAARPEPCSIPEIIEPASITRSRPASSPSCAAIAARRGKVAGGVFRRNRFAQDLEGDPRQANAGAGARAVAPAAEAICATAGDSEAETASRALSCPDERAAPYTSGEILLAH